jgi:hypothetical protein
MLEYQTIAIRSLFEYYDVDIEIIPSSSNARLGYPDS